MSDEKRIPLVLHLTADEYAALLTFTGQIRNEVTPESVARYALIDWLVTEVGAKVAVPSIEG